jgi:hypothetical protein
MHLSIINIITVYRYQWNRILVFKSLQNSKIHVHISQTGWLQRLCVIIIYKAAIISTHFYVNIHLMSYIIIKKCNMALVNHRVLNFYSTLAKSIKLWVDRKRIKTLSCYLCCIYLSGKELTTMQKHSTVSWDLSRSKCRTN